MVTTRIDLGVEYLGGLTKPTADDVGKLAVVALDSLGKPNFEYLEQTASVADDTFASTLAPFLRGVGLTVDSSNNLKPRARPRRFELVERFIGGTTTSGNVGQNGWSIVGVGTPSVTRVSGDLQSSSKLTLSSSGAANDIAALVLGETASRTVAASAQTELIHLVHNANSDLTNKRFFFGFSTDFAVAPTAASGCLGFFFDQGVSDNWQLIGRSGGVGSPSVTSTAFGGGAEILTVHRVSTTYNFYSGNTSIGSLSSGTPTGAMNFGVWMQNINAAVHTHRLGGIWLVSDLLTGAYDDDAFLEV